MGEIAGYRILSLLGTGAGSEVFEVQDPADGKLYALKVVNKKTATDQRFVDQALNEHEVGSRLNHPLIRRSLRVIRHGGLVGTPSQLLLLLELVDGTTLELRRPRSRRMMVDLFRQVATGLGAMHEAGIVHADMKPINILLESGGGLKIIDFGQSCPINTVKTRIQGTLDYIAPEQVKRRQITPRTDIYNLGATMYWCVTDHHPPTALRLRMPVGTRQDLADDVLYDPRKYNPHLPAALATLMLDCLRPDPLERPGSMRDVIRRLDLARHQLEQERAGASPGKTLAKGPVVIDLALSDDDVAEALAGAAIADTTAVSPAVEPSTTTANAPTDADVAVDPADEAPFDPAVDVADVPPPFGDPSEVDFLDEDALVAMLQQVNDPQQEIDFPFPAADDPGRVSKSMDALRPKAKGSAQPESIDVVPKR
ncbi:MAG: serine/threonine-protein kinase [Planctomycetota bacterium]|nr:serine/threonine-protein kinase [Planctomycetota bacterium]